MRRILLIVTLIVLALAGVVAWFAFSLDSRVARMIERAGSEATGTRVSVGGVSINLRDGTATVSSLRVGNPGGYSVQALLDAEDIRVDVDLSTLAKDVLVIDEVTISAPRMRLEVSKDGQANVGVVAKHAESRSGPSTAPRKLRIRKLTIKNAEALADATLAGGTEKALTLRPIVRENLGGKSGASAEDISAEVVDAIRDELVRAAAREGLKRYLDGEKAGVKEKLKGLFRR